MPIASSVWIASRSVTDTTFVSHWLYWSETPLTKFSARRRNPNSRAIASGLTSALGLVYWVVTARTYSLAAVGVSAALISAMTLLANLAQVNFKSALNRFLPTAGHTTARFVTRSYAVALSASAVASVIFLAGLDIWVAAAWVPQ